MKNAVAVLCASVHETKFNGRVRNGRTTYPNQAAVVSWGLVIFPICLQSHFEHTVRQHGHNQEYEENENFSILA